MAMDFVSIFKCFSVTGFELIWSKFYLGDMLSQMEAVLDCLDCLEKKKNEKFLVWKSHIGKDFDQFSTVPWQFIHHF